jgi:hypothetical protein
MDKKLHFGKHWMCLEGDTLFCKYVGMISVPDVQESMQILDKMLLKGTTYYILADVAEVTGMEAAARKISTDWYARHDIGGAVNFGAGALTRAIGALILSLLRLLHKNNMPTYFVVKTEEEGRAWIQEQRRRRAALKQSE